jgi:integrase
VANRYAPTTANGILSALRSVLHEAERLALMSAEDSARARDLKRVRGVRPPAGRALTMDELLALRGACGGSEALGARDRALLSVLFGGGLRRSEVVGLDVGDLAGDELRVVGKGNKARLVYLSPAHVLDVERWLACRGPGPGPGPLLCPVLKSGRVVIRRLSTQAVLVALLRLAERGGIAKASPHDARRTYITALLDRGADIAAVAALAGHASVTTTARYDRRGERAKRAAAQLLNS